MRMVFSRRQDKELARFPDVLVGDQSLTYSGMPPSPQVRTMRGLGLLEEESVSLLAVWVAGALLLVRLAVVLLHPATVSPATSRPIARNRRFILPPWSSLLYASTTILGIDWLDGTLHSFIGKR
jgi:hypothetical protein